jgi:hypothetical protein
MPTMTTVQNKPKYKIVCTTCGGDVVLLDAWAKWNANKQSWEVAQTFDTAFCQNCDGEVPQRNELLSHNTAHHAVNTRCACECSLYVLHVGR